tara:strand:+ start:1065 stop:1256 length:192 start_codon:yes stop_codon:yes gene_type:complete
MKSKNFTGTQIKSWIKTMQENEDDLNWTHFPQDKQEFTLADMSEDEARQAARKAKKAMEKKQS